MNFVLTRHCSVELDDSVHCNTGTVSVLSIGNVESFVAAFHLGDEEREIYLICGHKT